MRPIHALNAIETKKDPLPTAAQRKAELGY
jgi:hypothetical protein